ncbi:MAG: glutamine-oxaloacetic transaminase [Linnemannia gamsii]|nr:MAG: glutamine-oxaloacetic transaminase [Linnemannia gamsii]
MSSEGTTQQHTPALRLQQLSSHIARKADKPDSHAHKVNLGVGAYRTEEGKPWVLPVVKKADHIMVDDDALDHEYLPILGARAIRKASVQLILGANSKAIAEGRTGAAQCISGTGAVYTGAHFLSKHYPIKGAACYISKPTWAGRLLGYHHRK